jgi:hypothetical protein
MIQTIVALIANDANDLVPFTRRTSAHALPERSRWFIPVLAGNRPGNDDHRPALMDLGPGYGASGDQAVAHGFEIPGPHALVAP